MQLTPTIASTFYRHPIFADVIASSYFTGSGSFGSRYASRFNPMPWSVIALVATAVECSLKDWEKGKQATPTANPFTDQGYSAYYQKHLNNLHLLDSSAPVAAITLRRDLYNAAWCVFSSIDNDIITHIIPGQGYHSVLMSRQLRHSLTLTRFSTFRTVD